MSRIVHPGNWDLDYLLHARLLKQPGAESKWLDSNSAMSAVISRFRLQTLRDRMALSVLSSGLMLRLFGSEKNL